MTARPRITGPPPLVVGIVVLDRLARRRGGRRRVA
jgi:hypothetical protein